MKREMVRLSKAIARALRHSPWLFELEIDQEGWTPIDDLLEALSRARDEWRSLTRDDLMELIAQSDKKRYQIEGDKIRAYYGHSLPGRLLKTPAQPPDVLYHGTTDQVLDAIRKIGLLPMRRQYVHLSTEQETANLVAQRKKGKIVILEIRAGEAYQDGIGFYLGNEMVWLSDPIPPEYIVVPTA
ncbi:MAG: RNA 2'-phosphotransferase [Anaerolineae bacterium]|nr:RNA 2'-phosphotransferase [Anaerolineae bacterium]